MLLLGAASLALGAAGCLGADVGALGGPGRRAVAGCALLAGLEPRRNRPFALPIALAGLGGTLAAALAGDAAAAGIEAAATAATAGLLAAARASVNGPWLRGGP